MALVRLFKDPLGKPETHQFNGNLVDWLADNAQWASNDSVIKLNGKIIAKSGDVDADKKCDINLTELDGVDVYSVPGAGLSWLTIALIAAGAAAVSYLLMPKPKLPGPDSSKGSSNNQLNAANNAFRPREAIPDVAGSVISYPDFLQRSFYTYVNNRRVFTELFCFGVGRYTVADVKDGSTLINDLPDSSFTVYEPTDTIPSSILLDVRPVEAALGIPLPATDAADRSATIINGRFLFGDSINLGETAPEIIADLGLEVGDDIDLDVDYISGSSSFTYVGSHTITAIGALVEVSPSTLPTTDPGSVQGLITKTGGSSVGDWFTLEGDSITEIRWHLETPQGIRKGDGTNGTIGFFCEYQEIDAGGTPIGPIVQQGGTFVGNTQEAQYQTRFATGLTASRYQARAYRTTASLGNNAADLLRVDRIESVTPYSASEFGDVTAIAVTRASSAITSRGASEKISANVTRKLQLFDPVTATFDTAYTATRSFAQYIMYLLSTVAGEPLSNIDYDSLFAIESSLTDAQLGYFDLTFDDVNVSLKERLETCLNAARCYYYMIGNKYTFGRDEARAVRTALFNRRNTLPEMSEQDFTLNRTNDYDSVEIKYVDPVSNSEAYIRRRINPTTGAIETGIGLTVNEIELAGCRNSLQATNRADMEIRKIKYQWRTVKDTVMSEGMSVGPGDRIGWCDINDSEIFGGEVLEDLGGGVYLLSEPWTPEVGVTYYGYIIQGDGTIGSQVVVTQPVGEPYQVSAAWGTVGLSDDYEIQVGSLYVIAPLTNITANDFTVVTRGKPDQDMNVPLEMVNYDERVYEMD